MVRPSIAVVTFTGRDGQQQGLGTGFVVDAAGLVATNLHVVGEGRPLSVQLADGIRHDVTEITAFDRASDLAVLRIAQPEKPLVPLPLGDSADPPDGLPVVTVGNPHGLTFSVVGGVVSGVREVEGRPMIQLAMPIEPGNSGGPVVDPEGRVIGVVTIKSLVTKNLGFAVRVAALKPLLEKPNPVPMLRWLTIGRLDPARWSALFGARWQQRGGLIAVSGSGAGFGGRSLCLAERQPPALPFDLAVSVTLDDEAGAAGLAFHADGGDRLGKAIDALPPLERATPARLAPLAADALDRYLEALVAVAPDATRDRLLLAVARFEAGRRDAAIEALEWFLANEPPGIDIERIGKLNRWFREAPIPPR